MAWGFLDWVRGRPYVQEAEALTLSDDPSSDELRATAEQKVRMKAIDRMMNAGKSLPDDGIIWEMEPKARTLLYDYAEAHPEVFGAEGG